MKTIESIIKTVESRKVRSAWDKGVKVYALELLEDISMVCSKSDIAECIESWNMFEKMLLNGARDWRQYSEGGCALCYDTDIAKRLCTPSELKKTNNGLKNPNKNELWIDVQSRALYQARNMIRFAWYFEA